jgi:PAS domain S-box-containing protein
VVIPLAFLQRAKRQAEAERQRLQQVADGLPVQISHLDRNLRYLFVNQAYRRWLGREEHQEVVGRTMPEVLGQEVFQRLKKHIDHVLGGQAVEFEDVRTLPNGEKRYLHVRYMPAYDAQGRVSGLYGLLEDITPRRQAELAHRVSEHKFAAAFHAAPVILVISTQREGRILEVNDAFCLATGYRREEVLNRTVRELGLWRYPWDRQRVLELLQRDGQVDNLPVTLVDREGRDHYCLFTCRPLDYQGEPCLVALVMDITDRVVAEQEKGALERQLRQARHMETVGSLAGGIAHDFNNILAAIIGYSELVLAELPPDSQARANQEKVLRAAQRAQKLIKQILTFSQHGATGGRQPVRLAAVLEEALALLKSSLPSSVELRLDLQAPEAVVMADPTQLHQVFMNLCVNAAQAMEPDGGTLAVSLREENLLDHPTLPPGRYLCLEVCDTGQGISSQDMARIFEPYFTTKQPGHGTGLGLSVVHGIVQELGGAIKVTSTPGQGSCFRVYLPMEESSIEKASDTSEVAIREQDAALPPGGRERILLVDDEEDVADMCRQALERLGYRVRTFYHSPEALAAFQADPEAFDLVITDQTMPHLTGPALAQQITRLRPDIPVIMYTGYNPGLSPPPPAAGIREILPKPLGLHSLAWAVRRVLDQS